jgi:hypothetical protein
VLHSRASGGEFALRHFPLLVQVKHPQRAGGFTAMQIRALRNVKTIFAAILFAASITGHVIRAQGNRAPSQPVPIAPAGGLDPSKLPDIQGIHLGMSPQDALARLKVLFPGKSETGYGTHPHYARYQQVPGSSWMSFVEAKNDACQPSARCEEEMYLIFNLPPEKQGVISIQRSVLFQQGKEPTPDVIKAALLKKYGANPIVINPGIIGWAFDETGAPVTPKTKGLVQCAGNLREGMAGGLSPSVATPVGNISNSPISQNDLIDFMRDACRVGVYVLATITVAGQVVTQLDVKVSENSADSRAVIASQKYVDNIAAGQNQQKIKNAQKQTAPPL